MTKDLSHILNAVTRIAGTRKCDVVEPLLGSSRTTLLSLFLPTGYKSIRIA